jgi:hypothetical protein
MAYMEVGINQKPGRASYWFAQVSEGFENQTPIRTGSHCQIASQGWNGPDEQICNWGFQEKSLLKTPALMTTI